MLTSNGLEYQPTLSLECYSIPVVFAEPGRDHVVGHRRHPKETYKRAFVTLDSLALDKTTTTFLDFYVTDLYTRSSYLTFSSSQHRVISGSLGPKYCKLYRTFRRSH